MAIQVKITDLSGSPKKIGSPSIYVQMAANAMWFSTQASSIAINDILSNDNKDWIILQPDKYVEVEFTPDSGSYDGQGIQIGSGLREWKVTAITGTVKILRALYATYATTKASAYTNPNAANASVNDLLKTGDYLICSKTSKFSLKMTATDQPNTDFTGVPIVAMLSN